MKKTVKKALALSMTAALFMTACSQKAAETPPVTAGGDTGTAATEAAAAATEGKIKGRAPGGRYDMLYVFRYPYCQCT